MLSKENQYRTSLKNLNQEKTCQSNLLQTKLQSQHFLHSYLKTLSVGPAESKGNRVERENIRIRLNPQTFLCGFKSFRVQT